MAELILEHISKIYPDNEKGKGRKKAVDDISFTVFDKEFMVLVGPSGCGKSTLLRMIAGLEEISEGSLLIDGNRMNERSPRQRDIAMVFQNYALYPHMTVYDNMAFGLKLQNFNKSEIRKRVMETAQLLEIEDELNKRPKSLSGGQRQRVAIGRAIIRRPKVFLFDEPLSNLDAKLRSQMRIELQRLHREINATMVYVTHDQTEAMTLGHRIAVLNKGKLMQLDTPMNLYDHPANQFVAGFIGSPSMNFLKGQIRKEQELYFEHVSGQFKVSLEGAAGATLPGYIDKEVILGIRPEHIYLPGDGATTDGALEVIAFENMGNEQLIYLALGNQKIIVRRPQTHEISIGDRVNISLSRNNILFMEESTGQVIGKTLQANSATAQKM